MTSALGYTLAAIGFYVASDWILQRAEVHLGRRLQYRSVIFFVILLTMSVSGFALLRELIGA